MRQAQTRQADAHAAKPASPRSLQRSFRKFKRSEDGGIFVEFALVAGIFLILVFGVIEFGLISWQKSMVTGAAREGTRFAIVRGTQSGRTTNANEVATFVRSKTSLSPIVVTTTWPGTKAPGQEVIVKVDYTHRLGTSLLRGILGDSRVLSSTSRMVITF